MMKELHIEFLLAWRCSRTDRPKNSAPSLKIHPTVDHVPNDSVMGEFVILDTDGSEWKATYRDRQDQIDGCIDFNCLIKETIKIRIGES